MKEIINKYIEFALSNWYEIIKWYSILETFWPTYTFRTKDRSSCIWRHYLELITSKKFIEAIARWYIRTKIHSKNAHIDNVNNTIKIFLNKYIDEITHNQSFAIRDNKLEEFIEILLN